MFIKLTVPPTLTCRAVTDSSRRRDPTPTPNRHDRKSLICNHPNRATIAFLIDTAAIRNAPNSFRTNETFVSNRHKTRPFYVPHHGAIRQSASAYGGDGSTPPQSYTSTRYTSDNRNRRNPRNYNDIHFSTRYKFKGGNRNSAQFHGSRITSHSSLATSHCEGESPERIEPLGNRGEGGIGMMNDFAFGGFERLFGGDAGEPAIMGKLFVA
jgi:hypothetical protein